MLHVGGLAIPDLVADVNTPAYVLDEDDFRASGRRAFRDAFGPAIDVYYAGKAFLCTTVARWVAEEGLFLDVCSGGELAVAVARGRRRRSGSATTATTRPPTELRRADRRRRRADRRRLLPRDRARRCDRGRAPACRPRVMVRVTAGVEAHTHEFIATAHEDQKFGFSISSGDAFEAASPGHRGAARRSSCWASTRTSAAQIFDTAGFEVAARRVLALHARIASELGVVLPEMDLGGGFGIAYTSQDDPKPAAELAAGMRRDRRATSVVPSASRSPVSRSNPAGPSSGRPMCTVYTVGTVKQVQLDGGAVRTYVSVDGGMSDNIRTALYDADYSCTLASRTSDRRRRCSHAWSASTASRGDIVVKDEFLPGRRRARAT